MNQHQHMTFYESGNAYGLCESKERHNSIMLAQNRDNAEKLSSSSEVYQDTAEMHINNRQGSKVKYLKQINFDDLIPPHTQQNPIFDLNTNTNLRGNNFYRTAKKSLRNDEL